MKGIRKFLSVILSLVLVLSVALVGVSAENELRFTVAADTHYQTTEKKLSDVSRESQQYLKGMENSDTFWYASQQGELDYESRAIVKSMLNDFVNSSSDYLLLAGDLTDGLRSSHLEMAQLLRETEQRSGKEIFVTVGNHDCAKKSDDTHIDIDEFKEIYADFGFNQALDTDSSSLSYTVDLSDGYRLLAIDSCIYGEDTGKISSSTLKFIENASKKAEKDNKKLIAMMHHSILKHYLVQPMISSYKTVARKLSSLGIKTVFTGHIHANDISSEKFGGNTLFDIQTGSLITNPNTYRNVVLSNGKMDIKCKSVAKLDVNDLVDGYTEGQKQQMTDDFEKYAYNFYEAGICRWLNRNIGSAGKIGKKLKLKDTSLLYRTLDKILLDTGDTMAMNLYGDGESFEKFIDENGGTIVKSEYDRFYQVTARVMNNFFSGTNAENTNDTELFLQTAKVVIAKTIGNTLFGGKMSGSIFRVLNNMKIIDKLILFLTKGMTSDMSAPTDLDVVLDI